MKRTDSGELLQYHIYETSTLCCSLAAQVVSDARRLTDLQWFWSRFPRQTQTVRVQSSEETRRLRGWSFTPGKLPRVRVPWLLLVRGGLTRVSLPGVDDAESECGLDSGVRFDWIITNEADAPSLEEQLQPILRRALGGAEHQPPVMDGERVCGMYLDQLHCK